jgi:hypothetical protein
MFAIKTFEVRALRPARIGLIDATAAEAADG